MSFKDTMKGLFGGKTTFSKTVSIIAIVGIIAFVVSIIIKG